MIASRLGVWITTALALLLVIVVAIDLARDTSPPSRALVPGFDAEHVTRLVWARGKDEPTIELVRTDKTWRWAKPVAGIPAEPSAVDGVLAALRGARWHRREPIARAGTLQRALTVTMGERTLRIGVGTPLAGAGQTWLAIGDHAFLVDDWVARALAPEPLALRETRPFRDAATANTIVLERLLPQRTAVRIEGHPRRLVRPIELLLDAARADAIDRALSGLTITGTPTVEEMAEPGVAATLSIVRAQSVDGTPLVTVELFVSPCKDGSRRINGTTGPACIQGLERLWDQLSYLHRSSRELVERRLVPVAPVRITLPDGGVLDLAKRPKIGDDDTDASRVAELLALLQTPLEPVDDTTTATPVGTLAAVDRAGGTIVLELLPSHRVRRTGEPVAFLLGAGAWEILTRPSSALRDPSLWREDPTTIRSITMDGTVYARGAVIGEWSAKSEQLEPLANALANARGTPLASKPAARHTLAFEVVPPGGAPVTHRLVLGDRCEAQVEGSAVVLDKPLCDAIGRMLRP